MADFDKVMAKIWLTLIIVQLIHDVRNLEAHSGNKLTYSRVDLLLLWDSIPRCLKPVDVIPADIQHRPRKRGRRGGIRTRLRRRPSKPLLPAVVMANVQSLRGKMDILHAKCRVEKAFREASIIALTESWLNDSITEGEVSLDNFTTIRADRTKESGKERGGGICIYINDRWCNNIIVHAKVCTPDIELLTLSLRPFSLFREFPTLVFSTVYIHPGANIKTAAEIAARSANHMLDRYPNAPAFILGDFNNCRLETVLPYFKQYVAIPTRKDNVLDLFYGNISNAYRAQAQPPLGSADHNLLPQYTQLLKRHKPQTYSVYHWSEEAIAILQGSVQTGVSLRIISTTESR